MRKQWKQWETSFLGAPKSQQMVTAAMKLKDACSLEEKLCMTNLDIVLKSRDITLLTNVHLVKAMVFPVVMYGCESWTIKKADAFELWCWRRLLRVPWTARRSSESILRKSVLNIHWKDWCWSCNSSTLATWCEELIWKDPDAGKDWRQEEKGMTEDEMVGWHHQLNRHEFAKAQEVGDGQGSLTCCSPWVHKKSDMTQWLNWPEL